MSACFPGLRGLLLLALLTALAGCAGSKEPFSESDTETTANTTMSDGQSLDTDLDTTVSVDASTGPTMVADVTLDVGDPCAECPAGTTCCGDACVDLEQDVRNCGTCGTLCSPPGVATSACVAGSCAIVACQPSLEDCDDDVANGCEANLDTGLQSCGACAAVCQGSRCESGQCIDDGCATSTADCDGSPANGCEVDIATDPGNCGGCGNTCPDGETCQGGLCRCGPGGTCGALGYCFDDVCAPRPTFVQEPPCADLSVAHPDGGDGPFLLRYIVTGRPGATVEKWNRHLGCGEPELLATESQGGVQVLDANGRLEVVLTNAATACESLTLYGEYESWAVVDGIESNRVRTTLFNAACAEVQTCTTAQTWCDPSR